MRCGKEALRRFHSLPLWSNQLCLNLGFSSDMQNEDAGDVTHLCILTLCQCSLAACVFKFFLGGADHKAFVLTVGLGGD